MYEPQSHTHTLTHTHTLSLSRTHTHTRTHAHPHSRTRAHTRTHTHTLLFLNRATQLHQFLLLFFPAVLFPPVVLWCLFIHHPWHPQATVSLSAVFVFLCQTTLVRATKPKGHTNRNTGAQKKQDAPFFLVWVCECVCVCVREKVCVCV